MGKTREPDIAQLHYELILDWLTANFANATDEQVVEVARKLLAPWAEPPAKP